MLICAGSIAKLPAAAIEEANLEADRLLIERARQRLSIQGLAERSGVNAHTISDIERGVRKPRATTLAKLAEALGLEPEEFLGKAPAPSTSGCRSGGGDGGPANKVVRWDTFVKAIDGAGHIAREATRDWWQQLQRSSEEGTPLPKYRTLEMKALHNELSRLYVTCFKKILEAASSDLGTIGIIDDNGVRHYLSPKPSDWPQELREGLYEAGVLIAALPQHIDRIERETSEQQQQEETEQALYEEFNTESNHEELNKVLAEVGV